MMKKRLVLPILVLLLLLIPAFAFAGTPGDIYVHESDGSDTAPGTMEQPYQTLAKAVQEAKDGATIYVMSDLHAKTCARFFDKHLTIKSLGEDVYTVFRTDEFALSNDPARGAYNPALIEVQTTKGPAGLTLENIILDDQGKHEGTIFAQAKSHVADEKKTDNKVFVQDGMISSNATSDCTITLGNGAVLRNFGGMSAVRVTDHAKLIMKKGSVIEDTSVTDRTRGKAEGETGAAGAIWSQGSDVTVEDGAVIQNLIGRAIYMDGTGKANINSSILNITPDGQMWQGGTGYVLHLRGNAEGTLGGKAVVDNTNVKASDKGNAIQVNNCKFTMAEGSVLRNFQKNASGIASNGASVLKLDGEITGISGGSPGPDALNIQGENFKCTIGEHCLIHHNVVWYGAVYVQGKNGQLDIYGKINDNYSTDRGGALSMANNYGPTYVTMYPEAEICRNYSADTGGGIMVTRGTFTMKGGTISDNIAVSKGGGVYVRKSGSFIMEDGEIKNNATADIGGGIEYYAQNSYGLEPVVQLNGGTVEGNLMKADITTEGTKVTATGGTSNDVAVDSDSYGKIDRYISISDKMVLGDANIYMEKHPFNLVNPAKDMKFGNASAKSIDALKNASTTKGWGTPLATLWFQNPEEVTTLALNKVQGIEETKPVYALVIPADGNGDATGEAQVYAMQNLSVTIPSGNADGYVLAVVQPTEDYGVLTVAGSDVIKEDKTAENYNVEYTVTYKMSDNLNSIIEQAGGKVSYTLVVSRDAKLTGEADTSSFDGKTISVTYQLPAAQFEAGKTLLTSAVLTVGADGKDYVIPSNQVVTKMVPLQEFSVTASAGKGGKIDPDGVNTVTEGEDLSFTITADSGYHIADVKVDGSSIGAESSYTFAKINNNHTIAATFARNESGGGGGHHPTQSYTIYAKAENGGTITPDGTITVLRNSDKTFTIKPESGYQIKDILVDGKSVGALSEYTFETIQKNHTITALFSADKSGVPEWLNGEDHFAYIFGYPDGTIRPEQKITRAEVATIIFRLLDKDVQAQYLTKENSFADVPSDFWCNTEISTLTNMGIIKGYSPESFGPNKPITRAEFAALFARFDRSAVSSETAFTDISGHWAENSIRKAAGLGWISGYPDGTFLPNQQISRAESLSMINRVLQRNPESAEDLLEGMKVWKDNPADAWYYLTVQEATNGHKYVRKDGKHETWTELTK